MTRQSFSLIPFPAHPIPEITITGNIARQNNVLALHYSLVGNIEEIFLSSPAVHPGRRDELWKMTCLEFFLAVKDQQPYWEFNMSPSGDWNVYRMDAYRRIGFREETSIQRLPFEFKRENNGYSLDCSIDLSPIISTEQRIQAGITTVIQTKDGKISYWALLHPTSQADFHLKESFLCSL